MERCILRIFIRKLSSICLFREILPGRIMSLMRTMMMKMDQISNLATKSRLDSRKNGKGSTRT